MFFESGIEIIINDDLEDGWALATDREGLFLRFFDMYKSPGDRAFDTPYPPNTRKLEMSENSFKALKEGIVYTR